MRKSVNNGCLPQISLGGFLNTFSHVGSNGDDLRKKTQNQTSQGSLLKVVNVDGLSFLI